MLFVEIKLFAEPVVVAEAKADEPVAAEAKLPVLGALPVFPTVPPTLTPVPMGSSNPGLPIGSVVIGNKPYQVYKRTRDGYFRINNNNEKVYLTSGQANRVDWF